MNKMKYIVLVITLCGFLFPLAAENADSLALLPIEKAMQGRVVLHQSDDLTRMMQDRIEGRVRETVTVQGFRVQVFSDNNQQTAKADAFEVEKRIGQSGIESPVYVLYNPPFWKVRLGDFRTREEALLMKDEILRLLPDLQGSTYIVKDMIQVVE